MTCSVCCVRAEPCAGLRTSGRPVPEQGIFPTDAYMLEGLIQQRGQGHILRQAEPASVSAAIDESVALVVLQHVSYRTGAVHDMRALTAAAHARRVSVFSACMHVSGADSLTAFCRAGTLALAVWQAVEPSIGSRC